MFIPRMRAAFSSLMEVRARRNTARMLSGLNDATLKDIGIHRSQIDGIVEGMPYRGGRVLGSGWASVPGNAPLLRFPTLGWAILYRDLAP